MKNKIFLYFKFWFYNLIVKIKGISFRNVIFLIMLDECYFGGYLKNVYFFWKYVLYLSFVLFVLFVNNFKIFEFIYFLDGKYEMLLNFFKNIVYMCKLFFNFDNNLIWWWVLEVLFIVL